MRSKYPVAPDTVVKETIFLEGEQTIIWEMWKDYDHHTVFIERRTGIKKSFTHADLFRRGLCDPVDEQNPLLRSYR